MEKILSYTIREVAFKSKTSDIYRVEDKNKKRFVLKVLKTDGINSDKLARFKREHEVISQISSEYVIKSIDLLKYDESYAMVLEEFGGESLNKLIENSAPPESKDQIEKCLNIAVKIAKGLNEIHSNNIIHKDINPSNIVYNENQKQLKIIDFGLASKLENEQIAPSAEARFEGTFAYVSPEQTGRFNRTVDYRTDYYSLGVTLYELFAGKLPFYAGSPREWIHSHVARTPMELCQINRNIPKAVSNIIMKLMAKDSEKRYQSCNGIIKDLEYCLKEYKKKGSVEDFQPGKSDVSPRFQLSQSIYGRTSEIKTLLSGYGTACKGEVSLVLVSGKPGIGKTSVINEIQRPVVESNGYFISGKYEQIMKNRPYQGIIQAITSLIKTLLSEDKEALDIWKKKLLENLNGLGQLIINEIPELELIIGPQEQIPSLPPVESHNRFFNVFQKLITIFASKQHPLVIFLDDLQWADTASIEMIQNILINQTAGALMIIGAYRSSEVHSKHPVTFLQERIKKTGINYKLLNIHTLDEETIEKFLSDAFRLKGSDGYELAQYCKMKTDGNPFFLVEFLRNLYQSRKLYFDTNNEEWKCDFDKIAKADVAENVATLISTRVRELPENVQDLLKCASCIGSVFDVAQLLSINCYPRDELIELATRAALESIIYPLSDNYRYAKYNKKINTRFKFVHDRVQQEIYHIIPEDERARIHCSVGQSMLKGKKKSEIEDEIFLILEHLNKGRRYLDIQEKTYLVELNVQACKKAKIAGAFEHALYFIQKGYELLDNNAWKSDYNLSYSVHLELSEAYALCGNFDEMESCLNRALGNVTDLIEKTRLLEVRIQAYITQHRQPEAVSEALDLLALLGEKFPKKPAIQHTIINLLKTSNKLKNIKEVADLKLSEMKDPLDKAAMNLMAKILSASYYVNSMLFPLIALRLVNKTLEKGLSPKSPVAFITYGLIQYSLKKYDNGYLFSRIGMELFNNIDAEEHWSQSACIFYTGMPWKASLEKSIAGLYEAYKSGIDTGDLEFAGASIGALTTYEYYAGKSLDNLFLDINEFNVSLDYFNLKVPLSQTKVLQQTIYNLTHNSSNPEQLEGEFYSEKEWLGHFDKVKDKASANNLYINKMQLAYLFKKYESAAKFTKQGKKYVKESGGLFPSVLFYFYESLILLSITSANNNRGNLKIVSNNLKKIGNWIVHCPENFSNKWHLVAAELEGVKGNILQAGKHYDKSIEEADKNGFIHEKAIANERAGEFWLKAGKPKFAQIYLNNAYKLYNIWGAKAKAEALYDEHEEYIIVNKETDNENMSVAGTHSRTRVSGAVNIVDFETVLEAAKTISGEIYYSTLVKKSLTIILEQAGAQNGALFISNNKNELNIEATGRVDEDRARILLDKEIINKQKFPLSVINYVKRTQEIVLLHNAAEKGDFTNDEYIKENGVRSILAIPIFHQSKITGLLYLENNLSTKVFTQQRVDILSILCTQTAISIENALLYNSLERKVEERTVELSKKNKLLVEQKESIEKAHMELEELNATKDKFFSIIAHDLRGPIGNINSFYSLLVEHIKEHNIMGMDKLVNAFHDASKNTYKLLVNLLDWARSQRGEIEYKPALQSVNELVKSNLSLIEQRAYNKEALLVNELDEEIMAFFDTNLIDAVIRNLLENAVKYVRKNDKVSVSAEEKDDFIIVSVSDTGIGMNKETQDRLFAIGSMQASNPGTSGEKGTGLGLILCKEFVVRNGGKIWVESELGKGSIFRFTIPRR